MYRLNIQKIITDNKIYNLSAIRKQVKKDYDISDQDYFKCLDGQNLEFFDSIGIEHELLEVPSVYYEIMGKSIKLNDIATEDITDFINHKISYNDLAIKYHVPNKVIRKLMTDNAIKQNKVDLNKIALEDILAYQNGEISCRDVAIKYEYNYTALLNAFSRAGVKVNKEKFLDIITEQDINDYNNGILDKHDLAKKYGFSHRHIVSSLKEKSNS
jgi:hypothetical protein